MALHPSKWTVVANDLIRYILLKQSKALVIRGRYENASTVHLRFTSLKSLSFMNYFAALCFPITIAVTCISRRLSKSLKSFVKTWSPVIATVLWQETLWKLDIQDPDIPKAEHLRYSQDSVWSNISSSQLVCMHVGTVRWQSLEMVIMLDDYHRWLPQMTTRAGALSPHKFPVTVLWYTLLRCSGVYKYLSGFSGFSGAR